MRKIASPPFTHVLQHEHHVDLTVADFMQVMRDRFADVPGEEGVVDMTKWTDYFALDAVSRIVYEKEYGFVKSDTDVHGLMGIGAFLGPYWQYVSGKLCFQAGMGCY